MVDRAFLDTCSLYSIALTDTLLRLAQADVIEPKWSADVLHELRRNLIANRGLTPAKADQRISAMQRNFRDAEVTDYSDLEPGLGCDPKDRHVLAAALRSESHDLVTFNLKDFPPHSTEGRDIRVVHPDRFLRDQLARSPDAVLQVIRDQARSMRNPALSMHELLSKLERAGVPGFAAEVRHQADAPASTGLSPAHEAAHRPQDLPTVRHADGHPNPGAEHTR